MSTDDLDGEILTRTRFQTPDGVWHDTKNQAQLHLKLARTLGEANVAFSKGAPLSTCYEMIREFRHPSQTPSSFKNITKDSKLKMSEKPGYQVMQLYFTKALVGGDVGAWSGPYCDTLSYLELDRYAQAGGVW